MLKKHFSAFGFDFYAPEDAMSTTNERFYRIKLNDRLLEEFTGNADGLEARRAYWANIYGTGRVQVIEVQKVVTVAEVRTIPAPVKAPRSLAVALKRLAQYVSVFSPGKDYTQSVNAEDLERLTRVAKAAAAWREYFRTNLLVGISTTSFDGGIRTLAALRDAVDGTEAA